MITYITKRLIFLVPTLLGVTLITFILVKNIPGDPVYGLVGQRANPELIKQYKEALGLDESIIKQYCNYIKLIANGDFGYSYYTNIPVGKIFWQKFPNTIRLAIAAIIFAVIGGLILGIIASIYKDSFIDRIIMLGVTCGISLPVFWWGLVLIIIFSYTLGWLPASSIGGTGLVYIILPAITLGSRSIAYLARITRASMLEIFNQPYIVSARARGIGFKKIIIKHSLKNALIPIITIVALDLGSYLNGAVLTETIFGWDGIGRLAVTAIFKRDYPIILSVVLWSSFIFVLINLIADICYQFVNPKIEDE